MAELNADEKLEKLQSILDGFEKEIGLPNFPDISSNDSLLNFTEEDLKKMTHMECEIKAAMIAQYSFNLQRAYNKQVSICHFCEENLNKYAVGQFPRFKFEYAGFTEKLYTVIRNDDYGQRLNQIKNLAQSKIKLIDQLSQKLDNLARIIERVKRG